MGDYSIRKAIALTAIAKYSTFVLQLIFTAILSRILTPTEYGTVAIVLVFGAFFTMVSDMGLGTAVIQNKSLTQEEVNGIFAFTIILGIVLMSLFCGLSFFIADFYEDVIFIPLGFILSVSLLLATFNTIPNAVMLKQKQFANITVRTVTVCVCTYLLTIFWALKGWGVYALALQGVATHLFLFVWNQSKVRLKLNMTQMMPSVKKIFGYSFFQFLSMFMNYFNRNLDNVLIGKVFSKDQLGYYSKSYSLIGMPLQLIPGVINPSLQPILSEHQHDKAYIYEKYIKILKVLFFTGIICSSFCVVNAREIIMLFFGSQWESAIIPFKLLSISIGVQLLINTVGSICQSIGNTKLLFNMSIVSTIIIIGSIVLGIIGGSIRWVALMVSIGYIINCIVTFYMLSRKGFGISCFSFASNFTKDIITCIIMIVVSYILPQMTFSYFASLTFNTTIILLLFTFLTYITGSLKDVIVILNIIKIR